MTKAVTIGLVTVLLVASPVLAAPGKSDEARKNHGQEVASQKTAEVPPVTLPTTVPVTVPPIQDSETDVLEAVDVLVTLAPSPTQKVSKGQLKKAVQGAVTQQETCDPNAEWKNHGAYVSCVAKTHPGGQVVSAAARSDVGKKKVSVTPSVSPTSTPSATPTEEPTPTPITSSEDEITLSNSPFETFINAIGRLIKSLPFLNKHS